MLPNIYSGKRVVITVGSPQEKTAAVSLKSNKTYVEMAYSLVQAFVEQGADVTLISTPNELAPPKNLSNLLLVETTQKMFDAIMLQVGNADIFVSFCAPNNPDALTCVARLKKRPITIGFVEIDNPLMVRKDLIQKSVDMMLISSPDSTKTFIPHKHQITLMKTDGSTVTLEEQSLDDLFTYLRTLLKTKENFLNNPRIETFRRTIDLHRSRLPAQESNVEKAIGNHIDLVEIQQCSYSLPDESNTKVDFYVYTKKDSTDKILPTVFFIPGTGWIGRTIQIQNLICCQLANVTGAKIIAPDHRLSPEYQTPTPFQDCYQIMLHVIVNSEIFNIDIENFSVSGFSSGGNMALQMCAQAQYERIIKIKHIFMMCGVSDLSRSNQNFIVDQERDQLVNLELPWFFSHYVRKEMALEDPRVSPFFLAPEILSQLPPMTLFFGDSDAARGDSEGLADKMRALGVSCKKVMFEGEHKSFWFDSTPITLLSKEITSVNKNKMKPPPTIGTPVYQ